MGKDCTLFLINRRFHFPSAFISQTMETRPALARTFVSKAFMAKFRSRRNMRIGRLSVCSFPAHQNPSKAASAYALTSIAIKRSSLTLSRVSVANFETANFETANFEINSILEFPFLPLKRTFVFVRRFPTKMAVSAPKIPNRKISHSGNYRVFAHVNLRKHHN